MASSFLSEISPPVLDPEKAPHLMIGAASPLWLMFGGAAMAGASWWWWASRWRQAVNVEAVMALAPEPVAPVPLPELQSVAPALAAPILEAEPAAPFLLAVETPALDAIAVVETAVTEAVVEPALEVAVEAVEVLADDLTQLVGVGPKLSAALGELGVTRFEQIAAWTDDEIDSFDALLNLKGRAQREAWVAQAQRLAKGPAA